MKQTTLNDWCFAQIPEIGMTGKIIALLGYLPNKTFLPGSGRIMDVDLQNGIATSESGTQYYLKNEEADGTNLETLKLYVNKYSKKKTDATKLG